MLNKQVSNLILYPKNLRVATPRFYITVSKWFWHNTTTWKTIFWNKILVQVNFHQHTSITKL